VKQVNQVLMTNDYSMFKSMSGNRDVNDLHIKRLKDSMQEKYISVPIIVNEKNQIIDGQHRFQSAKELSKPIYYIKIGGLKLQDVHRLNTNTKNWTADSYLDGYCKLGKEQYLIYRDFKERFGFGHNETQALLSNKSRMAGSRSTKFKDGDFVIEDYNLAIRNAEKIGMCSEYYEGYKRRSFVYAMLDLFDNDDYNHAEFLNKLSFQSVKLQDCTTIDQYLVLIEEIYNFKRTKATKVRFY
tara:strand:+ start:726 stop:1448 length:723 start_codon:yes stop_codon:yes gene_type:complete